MKDFSLAPLAAPARAKRCKGGEGGAARETPTALGRISSMSEAPKGFFARLRDEMRARHMSPRTQKAYLYWARRFVLFHGERSPRVLGKDDVVAFLNSLVVKGRVSASTHTQALCALLFVYRCVLGDDLPWLDELERPRRPRRLPVVLTRSEVRALLERMDGVPHLVASLLYGAGLRLLECMRRRAPASCGRCRRRWLCGVTWRAARQVSERCSVLALAVGLSGDTDVPALADGADTPSSPSRNRCPASVSGSGPILRNPEAGKLPFLTA